MYYQPVTHRIYVYYKKERRDPKLIRIVAELENNEMFQVYQKF